MNEQTVTSMNLGVPVWYNIVNYYNELAQLWKTIREARLAFNDAGVHSDVHARKCLEDWFTAQKIIMDYLYYDAQNTCKKDYEVVVEIHASIEKSTFSKQFAFVDMSPESWAKIKTLLESCDRVICGMEGKLGLFMHKKPKVEMEEYFA
jgi:hypothetical protein